MGVLLTDQDRQYQKGQLQVIPDDPSCKYQIDISSFSKVQIDSVLRLAHGPRQAFSTPWDGIGSDVANSTLHVLVAAVSQYPSASGFTTISFPVRSAGQIL